MDLDTIKSWFTKKDDAPAAAPADDSVTDEQLSEEGLSRRGGDYEDKKHGVIVPHDSLMSYLNSQARPTGKSKVGAPQNDEQRLADGLGLEDGKDDMYVDPKTGAKITPALPVMMAYAKDREEGKVPDLKVPLNAGRGDNPEIVDRAAAGLGMKRDGDKYVTESGARIPANFASVADYANTPQPKAPAQQPPVALASMDMGPVSPKAPGVEVGSPADVPAFKAPASLPVPAQAAAESSPAPTKPAADQEMEDAKKKAWLSNELGDVAKNMDDATDLILRRGHNDHTRAQSSLVQELLARRDGLRRAAEAQREADQFDPNSGISQSAASLLGTKGLPAHLAPLAERAAAMKAQAEAKKAQDLETARMREIQQGKLDEEIRHNKAMEGIKAEPKAGKAPKELTPKEIEDLNNDIESIRKLDELKGEYNNTHNPFGNSDYQLKLKAYGGQLAPALDPGSRGNAGLIKQKLDQFPNALTPGGDKFFDSSVDSVYNNILGRLNAYEAAGGHSPAQIARFKEALSQAHAAHLASMAAAAGEKTSTGAPATPAAPEAAATGPMPTSSGGEHAMPIKSAVVEPDGNAAPITGGRTHGVTLQGALNAAHAPPARQVVRKQINRALGKTRVTYSDGTVEVHDGI